MDLAQLRPLLTPAGEAALRRAAALEPHEENFLRDFSTLRRSFPEELARAALETAILRREAQVKFPRAADMFFTRPALEQASSQPVAAYRSRRFAGFDRLADLACSVGADTLALADLAPTLGIDLEPLRLEMARLNLAALDLKDRALFLQADLTAPLPLAPGPGLALFFDPARRSERGRAFSVEAYTPRLSVIQAWLPRFPALGVKISPGVQLSELHPYDCEVEFISLQGELKEAALWFGPLKGPARRATLLPGEHTLAAGPAAAPAPLPLSDPLAYIYEPDPAVLRAGLVADLGWQISAAQLDPDIAYLTAERLVETPFARSWPVEAWFPFSLKRLRQELRALNVGQVTVKKRGSPLQPEALIRDLRLSGSERRTLFLTHLRGRPIVILSPT